MSSEQRLKEAVENALEPYKSYEFAGLRKALAASETTDLERLVEWLDKDAFYMPPLALSRRGILYQVKQYIVDELGGKDGS